MPRKAFVSYSSIDATYVDTVVRELTRSRVLFDKQAFQAGERIEKAIKLALANDTILFVLLASKHSLISHWVRLEIDEAEALTALHKMSPLVILTDPSLRISDLPKWMEGFVAKTITRPSQATRLIVTTLFERLGPEFTPLFVGRDRVMEELERDLIGLPGRRPPHVVVAFGLDGVGRRTVVQRALKDNLSLDAFPTFALQEADSVENLLLQLVSGLGDLESTAKVDQTLSRFRELDVVGRGESILKSVENAGSDPAWSRRGHLLSDDTL